VPLLAVQLQLDPDAAAIGEIQLAIGEPDPGASVGPPGADLPFAGPGGVGIQPLQVETQPGRPGDVVALPADQRPPLIAEAGEAETPPSGHQPELAQRPVLALHELGPDQPGGVVAGRPGPDPV
jgi:hypothetical protein